MMMRHVTILLEAVARGLRAVRPRLREECFPEGGGVSVDSWTPGLKCRFHRHPTGPLPSGLEWTRVDSGTGDQARPDLIGCSRRIPMKIKAAVLTRCGLPRPFAKSRPIHVLE